ncbi:MAG: Npt1/Npt2 family nucleotide transporter [Planctomycetota bacterium]|jgi:AAA family ATP:ADP antiporter
MEILDEQASLNCRDYRAIRVLGLRAAFLFVNFFLIITALYHLKPASRSLFIGSLGAERLPYVWIATALIMLGLIGYYHRLVAKYSRFKVVLVSCLIFSGLLVVFRFVLATENVAGSVGFYVFVDILGVVLVEQFWSLSNSIYTTREGKSWYGLVGTGGLVGGVTGGGVAALLIKGTSLQTLDLPLVAAGIILLTFSLTAIMGRLGIYCEVDNPSNPEMPERNWRVLTHNRYLLLIAAILLLAQQASPFIEYQFLNTVQAAYEERETRTAFLSLFFSLLGLVSILINLGITPIIHRNLGVIAGLLLQPLLVFLCSLGFMLKPTLTMGSVTKISDRGLSYSINRASKELLYVPVDPLMIYQAKAWIDMFGYRVFKILGSIFILLFTQWLPVKVTIAQLSWFTLSICLTWMGLIMVLRRDYVSISLESA